MKEKDNTMFQEIFVKIKFSPEVKIHSRTFAWRLINFNKLWIKEVCLDQDKGEISFTSEFNAKFTRYEILDFITNPEKSYFTTGDGLSTTNVGLVEVIELKEEAEIYQNE